MIIHAMSANGTQRAQRIPFHPVAQRIIDRREEAFDARQCESYVNNLSHITAIIKVYVCQIHALLIQGLHQVLLVKEILVPLCYTTLEP